MRVGVISDTHGLLRDEVLARLAGVDLVLHAGDVGTPSVLKRLAELAPTLAVRGNVDKGELSTLPETLLYDVGGAWVYMLHDLAALDLSPAAAGIRVVISGHSHVPKLEKRGETLYLNPGSCGRRRFKLPVGLAFLHVEDGEVRAELVTLDAVLPE
ncbi:metallophosphoesterase family protein [Deinococcus yavapaiensis]|uniref:Phosphoesterase n=1 Tax=Deinococcus yavapaiensis KR-236 TaxID=694435 RepID=A0A318SNM8_9DEIO|nr:metallophosphoesterase family protein [Deinococcus yavapaiensis]PYE56512.1 hypothetical protein DES52_101316 [Deinococcus yavapaiensis KR-236]